MPETTAYEGRVSFLSILDEQGRFDEALGAEVIPSADLPGLYRWMVYSRLFDETAVSLQREGRMGTYAENAGQEAAAIGSAYALRPRDWIFPSYREVGAYLSRGTPPENVLLFWMGDERGHRLPDEVCNFPMCIPVGTQALHAAGAAWAYKIRRSDQVAVAYFGDGATSKGDFHEAANFAGVFTLPVIFFCANNQWAISVPRRQQTASVTLAQKALAYGIAGVQVDGNDLFAVVSAMKTAVARARRGEGATFIEAVTYRLSNHTTADDAGRYREPAEVDAWRRRDPIVRVRNFLMARGLLSEAADKAMRDECRAKIAEAVKRAESIAPPSRRDAFAYVFAQMPATLAEQLERGSIPAAETEGAVLPNLPPPAVPGEYLPAEPDPSRLPEHLARLRTRARTGGAT